jgi:heme/copper-type cytochrome/quinol oxidase subunit 3
MNHDAHSGFENRRPVLDVSGLPTLAFGHANVTWLGNVLYMTIEGTMFALVIASYFYLRTRVTEWPPGNSPPYLWYGVANGVLFLLSFLPARWLQLQAPKMDRAKVRLGLIVLALFGVACILLRVFEFTTLNCRWSDNAYASTVWVLLGLHSGHLVTEWIETLAILGISFTDKMEGIRFADVGINSDYWYFVVVTAVIVDVILYGTTRFL